MSAGNSNSKFVVCFTCRLPFANLLSLGIHITLNHLEQGYPCTICSTKVFTSAKEFCAHQKEIHKFKFTKLYGLPFNIFDLFHCKQCNNYFILLEDLKTHDHDTREPIAVKSDPEIFRGISNLEVPLDAMDFSWILKALLIWNFHVKNHHFNNIPFRLV